MRKRFRSANTFRRLATLQITNPEQKPNAQRVPCSGFLSLFFQPFLFHTGMNNFHLFMIQRFIDEQHVR